MSRILGLEIASLSTTQHAAALEATALMNGDAYRDGQHPQHGSIVLRVEELFAVLHGTNEVGGAS